MAKKKNRSANVARKREKRNRNRKTKLKQFASEKQKKLNYSNLDEEGLYTLLMSSRELTEEPEFKDLHFDLELTYNVIVNFLNAEKLKASIPPQDKVYDNLLEFGVVTENIDENNLFHGIENSDEKSDFFRTKFINKMISPEFILSLKSALSSCEKRFRRTGDRFRADAAFVSSAFFDAVPSEKYSEHPILEEIMLKTFEQLGYLRSHDYQEDSEVTADLADDITTNKPDFSDETFSNESLEVKSDEIPFFDDKAIEETVIGSLAATFPSYTDSTMTPNSTDTYPAKALYKNCIGSEIVKLLSNWQANIHTSGITTNHDGTSKELDLHITVSEDRLNLYAQTNEDLTIAMEKIETYCQSALIFLAKTIDEGGTTDGSE